MSGRIKHRWLLVLLIAAGQLAILLLAVLWFSRWLEGSMVAVTRQREVETTAGVVEQVAAAIATLPEDELDAVERLVNGVRLPHEGSLTLLRTADGTVLVDSGATTETDDAIVASAEVSGRGWLLVAREREAAGPTHIERFIRRVGRLVATLIIVVVVFSAAVTALVVRRYENRMRAINQNLGRIVDRRSRLLLRSRGAVIQGLARLAESRDSQTGRHLDRIGRYVRILAEELARTHPEIDADLVNTLQETSALHDIGKVGVPDHVLLSPDELDAEQRALIEKHPLIGGDTLLAIKREWGDDSFLVTACEICFSHHERWDGSGYPFGLSGETIPLAGRIVALADVYDALRTARVYKAAHGHAEARRIIVEGSGKHFDPEVVAAFQRCQGEFAAVAAELEDEG